MKNHIESVRVETVVDESPDTSWLGDYSNSPKNEFSIDRQELGRCGRGKYRYFNPASVEKYDANASWIPADCADKRAYWYAAMMQNAQKDFARMEALNDGQWHFLGIVAKAVVRSGNGVIQTLRSGGLWGIESDSGEKYLKSVADEQLAELRSELEGFGFGKRAIDRAFLGSNAFFSCNPPPNHSISIHHENQSSRL